MTPEEEETLRRGPGLGPQGWGLTHPISELTQGGQEGESPCQAERRPRSQARLRERSLMPQRGWTYPPPPWTSQSALKMELLTRGLCFLETCVLIQVSPKKA